MTVTLVGGPYNGRTFPYGGEAATTMTLFDGEGNRVGICGWQYDLDAIERGEDFNAKFVSPWRAE